MMRFAQISRSPHPLAPSPLVNGEGGKKEKMRSLAPFLHKVERGLGSNAIDLNFLRNNCWFREPQPTVAEALETTFRSSCQP